MSEAPLQTQKNPRNDAIVRGDHRQVAAFPPFTG